MASESSPGTRSPPAANSPLSKVQPISRTLTLPPTDGDSNRFDTAGCKSPAAASPERRQVTFAALPFSCKRQRTPTAYVTALPSPPAKRAPLPSPPANRMPPPSLPASLPASPPANRMPPPSLPANRLPAYPKIVPCLLRLGISHRHLVNLLPRLPKQVLESAEAPPALLAVVESYKALLQANHALNATITALSAK